MLDGDDATLHAYLDDVHAEERRQIEDKNRPITRSLDILGPQAKRPVLAKARAVSTLRTQCLRNTASAAYE